MLFWMLAACTSKGLDAAGVTPIDLPAGAQVFVGATLVPSGAVADVVIEGETITQIRPPGGVYTDSAIQIPAQGQFLAPGLADLHVHLWFESDLWLYLSHGVTIVRNLFGDPLHLSLRAEIEAGERAGPTLITAGPIIDGPDPYWPDSARVTDAVDAAAVAEEQIAQGYDALKVYDGVSLEAWEALVAAGAAAGVPVVGHVPDAVGYRAVAEGGQRTVEHLDDTLAALAGLEPFPSFDVAAGRAALAAYTTDAAAALASTTASSGVYSVPTLVVWRNLGQADTWDFADPRLDTLPSSVRRSWQGTRSYLDTGSIAYFADYTEALCDIVGELSAAGAPLALGTDVINPFVFPGDSVHEELALLVGCGLSPAEALEAATTAAAEALGQVGVFGVIAEGARADLLLLDADPTLDVAALARPAGVMVRGHLYTRAELDAQIAAITAQYE